MVDTSALPREEAEALVAGAGRPGCLIVVRDRLGRSVHAPRTSLGAAAGLALLATGCDSDVGRRLGIAARAHGIEQLTEQRLVHLETLQQLTALGGYLDDWEPPAAVATPRSDWARAASPSPSAPPSAESPPPATPAPSGEAPRGCGFGGS